MDKIEEKLNLNNWKQNADGYDEGSYDGDFWYRDSVQSLIDQARREERERVEKEFLGGVLNEHIYITRC